MLCSGGNYSGRACPPNRAGEPASSLAGTDRYRLGETRSLWGLFTGCRPVSLRMQLNRRYSMRVSVLVVGGSPASSTTQTRLAIGEKRQVCASIGAPPEVTALHGWARRLTSTLRRVLAAYVISPR